MYFILPLLILAPLFIYIYFTPTRVYNIKFYKSCFLYMERENETWRLENEQDVTKNKRNKQKLSMSKKTCPLFIACSVYTPMYTWLLY